MEEFLRLCYNTFVAFFSTPFITEIYMIALAGFGMIYIIKSILFFRRYS